MTNVCKFLGWNFGFVPIDTHTYIAKAIITKKALFCCKWVWQNENPYKQDTKNEFVHIDAKLITLKSQQQSSYTCIRVCFVASINTEKH